MSVPYRLGIDVGTNSIGWCVLDVRWNERDKRYQPEQMRRLGVRIFSDGRDPQSGTSLAVARRGPRQARRRRDRFLDRKDDLMAALVRHGLMPADVHAQKALESLDPYELRARGLDEKLHAHHFGRALFHLNQRRGFKSNRKTERGEDAKKEKTGLKAGMTRLAEAMTAAGARTLGEYLYVNFRKGRSVRGSKDGSVAPMAGVRARPRIVKGKAEYDFYASREMYEAEFDAIWAKQAKFDPGLTEDAREEIRGIIFFQRKLRPVDPGRCTFEPDEPRAPIALPVYQEFRIWQDLAHLKVVARDQTSRFLTPPERRRVYEKLRPAKELSFDRIRMLLGLDSDHRFNLESEKRAGLAGDATGRILADKKRFGPKWWTLDLDTQSTIVERLIEEEDEERLTAELNERWGLPAGVASAVVDASLPEGYARFSKKALARLLPVIRDQGLGVTDAARECGYKAWALGRTENDPPLDQLPYYAQTLQRHVAFGSGKPGDPEEKRLGKVANPTVHVALNQLRKIVNALVKRYGHPAEIVVELARELKLSLEQKSEISRKQADNQKKNQERAADLARLGVTVNGEALLKMRLWEELGPVHDRKCVYTGEPISIERLFGPEIEIEHILPFKRTLDNSPANRTVSLRRANRDKGNNSPHEAFGASPRGYDWDSILLRAQGLPPNKRWRFAADAMERFEREERDFLDRQLVDTQYLARLTREYLTGVCDPNKVWVTPGRLTEMMRGKWGLNKLLSDHNLKNRTDHRHHAIDAFVVGVTDRALLQAIASAADQQRERLIDDMPEPWDDFRDQLRERLAKVVVSHKPDHGIAGKLHEETAYGIIENPDQWEGATLVYRKPLVALNENECARVRDPQLREKLAAIAKRHEGDKPGLAKALAAFSEETGVRRVRLLKVEQGTKTIKHGPQGEFVKAYTPGDNHHVDLFEAEDGRWIGVPVTVFDAQRLNGGQAHGHPEDPKAKFVMRVHKGDLLRLEHDGAERIMQVHRLDAVAQRFKLAEHHEGGNLDKRHTDADDPFRWAMISYNQLKTRNARIVGANLLGRVNDPGPPE